MKKVLVTAAAIFAFGLVSAQKAKFGIKGGLNVADQSFKAANADESLDTNSLVGFHIGGFVDIKIADKFSIQPEVLYSAQGTKPNIEDFIEGIESFKTAYINVPVMVKYYPAKNFNLELGPQIGFLVDAKIKATVEGNTIEVGAKQLYQSIDFGINVGAGFDFTKNITAAARFNFGLSDIGDGDFDSEAIDITNSVLSISLGYKF